MKASIAAAIAALAVLAAIGAGLAVARIARPAPAPIHVTVTPTPTVTPVPTPVDEATLFRQPLSAGCATAQSVWITTNGGALLRYDGSTWSTPDTTLRSLTNVACTATQVYAVGLVGTFVVIDEATRQIQSTAITIDDLFGVAPVGDGALMVGSAGAVFILAGGNIQPYAAGVTEDLRDVVAFSERSAWAVGRSGITYRLDQRGWSSVGSGQAQDLHAIAALTASVAIAVGDAGTVVGYDAGWRSFTSEVDVRLRDVIVDPALWIVGDAGTLLTRGATVGSFRRVDIGTSCDLVSVFTFGPARDLWVVG
ncbi:MAG: hypothetical protein AAB295_03420, partial [Chloroflexota bacterium]